MVGVDGVEFITRVEFTVRVDSVELMVRLGGEKFMVEGVDFRV